MAIDNDNDGYKLSPQKPCTNAGFTKHSYRAKERNWTFDADHLPRNNRRNTRCVVSNCTIANYCSPRYLILLLVTSSFSSLPHPSPRYLILLLFTSSFSSLPHPSPRYLVHVKSPHNFLCKISTPVEFFYNIRTISKGPLACLQNVSPIHKKLTEI